LLYNSKREEKESRAMFEFTDIKVVDGWVHAHAKNLETGEGADTKINLDSNKNEFEISTGETYGYFVMALGSLRVRINKIRGNKIPDRIVINWGM
jgi:hypothetical protein